MYGIVKQSGGSVRVRSAPGEGADFEVLFPAVKEDAPELPAPRPVSKAPGANEMVLVVEDEAPLRRLVVKIRTDSGYRVEAAANAEEAIALCEERAARRENINLLLSDVIMPGIDGRQLAARLRQISPGLPVLFMSGYDENSGVGGGEPDGQAVQFLRARSSRSRGARRSWAGVTRDASPHLGLESKRTGVYNGSQGGCGGAGGGDVRGGGRGAAVRGERTPPRDVRAPSLSIRLDASAHRQRRPPARLRGWSTPCD